MSLDRVKPPASVLQFAIAAPSDCSASSFDRHVLVLLSERVPSSRQPLPFQSHNRRQKVIRCRYVRSLALCDQSKGAAESTNYDVPVSVLQPSTPPSAQ